MNERRRISLGARFGGRLVLIATLLSLAAFGYFGVRLYQDASALRASPQDNVQWTISRLEVEALRLRGALSDETASPSELRQRFDVFYSRVVLLRDAELLEPLRQDSESSVEIQALLTFLRRSAPIFDGEDSNLLAQRKALAASLEDVRLSAAQLSLRGNVLYSAAAAARLRALENLIVSAATIAGALILILGSTLIVLSSRDRLARTKQQEAEASNARMEAVASVALDPVIISDAEGRIIEYNAAAERVFGYPRSEAMGEEMANLFIPRELREAHRAGMARYLAQGDPHVIGKGRLELEAVRKSGERFPVELSVGEARESDGTRIFVGFMRDISRRKATEADLMDARDAALEADRAKSRFIAVMSHEMRTPLNGVLGVLDLLGATELDVQQAEYVDIATQSGEILLRHINDVLDITRIEAGKIEIAQEPFSVEDVVREVVAIGRPGAAARATEITWKLEDVPSVLLGDAHRVRQVLLNLTGNAAKFTTNGTIQVIARRISGAASADEIEFSVIDDGLGVSPENLERIFDDFVTLDTEYSREVGGSGLGLSICRRVVRAMGGEIGAESELGRGSRFWFRIHLQRCTPNDAPIAKPNAAFKAKTKRPGLNILLVEDNEINRLVANRMLSAEGHNVTEARDGVEGVEISLTKTFDVILMDISMPRMDGVEATKRILQGGANEKTPVIGLTAHVAPAEHENFLASGMKACVTKPLRSGALTDALAEHVDATRGSTAESAAAPHEDAAVIDEDVFDEFVSVFPPEATGEMIRRVAEELRTAASSLGKLTGDEQAALAHKAGGSAALVGARRAHAALSALEADAKAGLDTEASLRVVQQSLLEAASVMEEFAA